MLTLDVWADVVCPWCWIGENRLAKAVENLGVEAQWRFHAFELGARKQARRPVMESLAEKYHVSVEEAGKMLQKVRGLGAELGLEMNPEKQGTAATFDAHRLIAAHQAAGGDARVLMNRLHRAHFAEGRDVSDKAELAALAAEAGMDRAEAERVLSSDAYTKEVEEDLRRAGDYNVTGVPFTAINMRLAVGGAQPVEGFEDALKQALEAPDEGPVDAR